MKYVIFSKGLHATWLLDKAHGNLYDCGEGCGTLLGYQIFCVDRICLSHSHMDHIAGLPAFIGLRNATKGANNKPLVIYYPEGNLRIEDWINFSLKINGRLKYSLTCQPLRPWDQIPIFQGSQEKRYIEAFPVQHAREQCFGYRVLSVTKGLKFEFRDRGKEYYASLTPEQKAAIMEDRSVNKVLFSGDGMPLDSGSDSPLHCAETAFLDTTFMSSQDREGFNHGSLEEVAEACRNNHVKVAYAMHVSIRYQNDEIQKKLSEVAQVFPMRLIPNDRVVCLN